MEKPDLVNRLILDFLAEPPGPTPVPGQTQLGTAGHMDMAVPL